MGIAITALVAAGLALGIRVLHLGLWSVPLAWTAGWVLRAVATTLRLGSGDWERRRIAT
jgi:Na+-driven multidrug efflux pump